MRYKDARGVIPFVKAGRLAHSLRCSRIHDTVGGRVVASLDLGRNSLEMAARNEDMMSTDEQ